MNWIRSYFKTEKENPNQLFISTSQYVIYATFGVYVLFHFVGSLFLPKIFSPRIWICTSIMLFTFVFSIWLLSRIYYLAQIVWIVGIASTILSAYLIFDRPEILLLFCLLPLMSITMVGVSGTFVVEFLIPILFFNISNVAGFAALPSGYPITITALSIFTGVFGWGISNNLLSAIEDSSFHYHEARKRLEETRQHRAEISRMLKEQSQSNYQLKQMNRMLEQARARAEEAREDRDRFAMAVSHELRSPLNFIIGFSDLMINAPETYANLENWPAGLYDDVNEIYSSSKHLLGLINDILDMGKMDARRMPLFRERLNPRIIIDDIEDLVALSIRQKKLKLEIDCEDNLPHVFVDRTRIRQVLLNVITNSMRFTSRGSISLMARRKDEEMMEFIIKDTGPGISKEDLDKIFDEFRQVGQENWSRERGTGLGLPISKRLVELHGGKMWVESELGVGTTISITLPLMEPLPSFIDSRSDLAEGGEQRIASKYARQQSDILLCYASDTLQARIVGQSIFEQEVFVAESLSQLTQMAADYYPSAVIIDEPLWNEPEVQSVVEQLSKKVPVLKFLFSGVPNRSVSLPFGVYRYLVKPVSREKLIETILTLGSGAKQLLVVDDDPTMVRLFTQAIKTAVGKHKGLEEVTFLSAFTGREALDKVHNERVDAVLLDLDLPDIHGTQVLSEIKKDINLQSIPIIIISASDISEEIRLDQPFALQVLIHRPFERDELTSIVRTVINVLHPYYGEQKTKKDNGLNRN